MAPVVAVLLAFAPESFAAPVVWTVSSGGNGHTYEWVYNLGVSWADANTAAQAKKLPDGRGGYLATVDYWSEQLFIQSQVLPDVGIPKNQVWLGGRQDPEAAPFTPTSAAANWHWIVNPDVAPEAWDYTNWQSENEPSNYGSIDERFLTMWVHFSPNGQDLRGTWNDEQNVAPTAAQIIGYLVEWSVPEPATAALSALGIALLALRRRRS